MLERQSHRGRSRRKRGICFTYANAYGDETIDVSCTPERRLRQGLVGGRHLGSDSINGGATVALDIAGTPTVPGYAAFAVSGRRSCRSATARAKVYAMSEMPDRGAARDSGDFSRSHGRRSRGNVDAAESPAARVGDRRTHSLDSGGRLALTITVVEADGKTAAAVN